jgi:hypothetical protein
VSRFSRFRHCLNIIKNRLYSERLSTIIIQTASEKLNQFVSAFFGQRHDRDFKDKVNHTSRPESMVSVMFTPKATVAHVFNPENHALAHAEGFV